MGSGDTGFVLVVRLWQIFGCLIKISTVPVELKCPFCDKPYKFKQDEVSICPSCDLEIIPKPEDGVPSIQCKRKAVHLASAFLLVGLVAMFLFPPYGAAVGTAFLFAFVGTTESPADRCGNCGAGVNRNGATFCHVCRADFEGEVA